MVFSVYCDDTASLSSSSGSMTMKNRSGMNQNENLKKDAKMSRRELQSLAKQHGIKANMKSSDILSALKDKNVLAGAMVKCVENKKRNALKIKKGSNDENVDPRMVHKAKTNKKNKTRQSRRLSSQPKNQKTASQLEKEAKQALERQKSKRIMSLAIQEASQMGEEKLASKELEQKIKEIGRRAADELVDKVIAKRKRKTIVREAAKVAMEKLMEQEKKAKEAKTQKIMEEIQKGLEKQKQLQQQLEETRRKRKFEESQLQDEDEKHRAALSAKRRKSIERRDHEKKVWETQVLGLDFESLLHEKENIAPGTLWPVPKMKTYKPSRQVLGESSLSAKFAIGASSKSKISKHQNKQGRRHNAKKKARGRQRRR